MTYKFLNLIFMGKLQNNLFYFKISKDNQEKLLDDFYVFDEKRRTG